MGLLSREHRVNHLLRLLAVTGVLAGILLWVAHPRGLAAPGQKNPKSVKSHKIDFVRDVQPVFNRYCYECHGEKKKGDLDLRIYRDERSTVQDREVFEKVLKNVQAHEMPPPSKPQPTLAERELINGWINQVFFTCDCEHPDPGRVTIRRLNRVEYNNTIRDLVGISFRPADDFPADDSGYGFDNIGDVLSLSPVLLEKYLAAAERILDEAIVNGPRFSGPTNRFEAAKLECTAPGEPIGAGARSLTREGELIVPAQFPEEGEYILRAKAFGQQAGPEPARMEFRLDSKMVRVFDVKAVERSPGMYETKIKLGAGQKRFSAAYINNYVNPKDPNPANRDRNLIINYLEVVGPVQPEPLPETHRRIVFCEPSQPGDQKDCARKIIARFATQAFRRPAATGEVDRLMKLFSSAIAGQATYLEGLKVALSAVLVSPHFLFRGELQPQPDNPRQNHPIDEYALASRLSYFLWSSMPDEELFREAGRGRLRRNLEHQVRRMIQDEKSKAFVENFAGQWLQLRNLKLMAPDAKQFPAFDDELRAAMLKETETFFDHVLKQNRSVLDFIDADYSFVNEKLAQLYGINGVTGETFQRVSLNGTHRGGLLTHGSVLALTSNPTRTSPVKRGKWVLENVLGTPPPPAPPDVPELEEGKEAALTGTLRQRMEQHRANPACASCHARMDPIGFGLENFDAIGAWRDTDGEFTVNASGTLTTGESFDGPVELRRLLVKQKRDAFVRCLAEKVLTYALGRGLEYYDKCAVDELAKKMAKDNYRFSTLILEVTRSVPFQMRRGEDRPLDTRLRTANDNR